MAAPSSDQDGNYIIVTKINSEGIVEASASFLLGTFFQTLHDLLVDQE